MKMNIEENVYKYEDRNDVLDLHYVSESMSTLNDELVSLRCSYDPRQPDDEQDDDCSIGNNDNSSISFVPACCQTPIQTKRNLSIPKSPPRLRRKGFHKSISNDNDMDLEDFPSFLEIPRDHLSFGQNGSNNSLTSLTLCSSDPSMPPLVSASEDSSDPLHRIRLRSSLFQSTGEKK